MPNQVSKQTGRRRGLQGGDADQPTRLSRWRPQRGQVAAGVNQGSLDPAPGQFLHRFIDGKSLSDAPQVQPHTRFEELGRVFGWVEYERLMPDRRASFGQPFRGGEFSLPSGTAPKLG